MVGSSHMCGAKQWFRCWAPGVSVSARAYSVHRARHDGHMGYIAEPTATASIGFPVHPGSPEHFSM